MSSPSISVVNCVEAVERRLARAPIVVLRPSTRQTSWIHCSGAPWLQSSTSSASGQRVLRSLDLRSVSTSSPTAIRKGLMALDIRLSFPSGGDAEQPRRGAAEDRDSLRHRSIPAC